MEHHNKINKNTQPGLTPKTVQAKGIYLQDNRPTSILQKKANNTGLPDNLKSGIENLSGHAMDDVKVHYNSEKPGQLNAHAYAQGSEIHLASGQEKHLPHEAWHVVQQKQGRVKPTLQMKGKVNVNDDSGLEKEADVMGAKAVASQTDYQTLNNTPVKGLIIQRVPMEGTISGLTHVVQAVHGSIYNGIEGQALIHGQKIEVETSDKIRSRRGPNQELFGGYDAKNTPEYRWVKLTKIDGEPAPENSYVRDDTFEGGSDIPRGSVQYPKSIDHRQRRAPNLSSRTFASEHAPQWYERGLGYLKSSTADRKHAKLLSIVFNCAPDEIGRAMVDHAHDEDMLMTLETVGQHMTHIAPWIPTNAERHGKDRHEDYEKSGEYFRTSQTHPVHEEFERHQQALDLYREGQTTDPVNPGWAHVADKVMGVRNMSDDVHSHMGIPVRVARDPDRVTKGPGAVIGHEEMARETARMQLEVMKIMRSGRGELAARDFREEILVIDERIATLEERERQLRDEIVRLNAVIASYSSERKKIGPQIGAAKSSRNEQELLRLGLQMEQLTSDEQSDRERLKRINKEEIPPIPVEIAHITKAKSELEIKRKLQEKYSGRAASSSVGIHAPKSTDLSPLSRTRPSRGVTPDRSFATHLLANRSQVKLQHLFNQASIGEITDVSGDHHPNIVLEKEEWKKKDGTEAGLHELQDGWRRSDLHTDLQERGSFGHHRPSISPLDKGKVRINPGLYPMSLLQIGIGAAIGAKPSASINPREDFIHRHALEVAVQHALSVIGTDRKGNSEKIERIKTFAKHSLMINILKAQTILKAPIPDPGNRQVYLAWLEKDFSKTSLALENLNESTHLLLSARVNEESKSDQDQTSELLLQPGPFEHFVHSEFGGDGGDGGVAIYYVASGMQAITTAAMAAVHYRRDAKKEESGKPAGYVRLHPYFEMKDKVAKAAGFDDSLSPETIISDLSPLDTTVSGAEQSREAVKGKLASAVASDNTLVPVLDATAFPMGDVKGMVPVGTKNFIIVESLTKYAQMGSDKALGGRIIVVGDADFLRITADVIKPVEQNAGMIVSRVWFKSVEDMRYSH